MSRNPALRASAVAALDAAAPDAPMPLSRALPRPAAWAALALVALLAAIRLAWPGAGFGPHLAFELLAACAMAMGTSVVMIGGGIDLSGGAVMALAGGIAATALHAGLPWWLALAGALAGGGAFGAANGGLVAAWGLPPAIATLGSLAAADAVASALGLHGTGGAAAPLGHPLRVLAALAAGMAWALSMTVWGRHVVASGGNAVAARAQGVRVAWVGFTTYVVAALLASLAGVALLGAAGTAALGAGVPGIGGTLEAIAAATLGGVSLSGGEGGIGGALVGAALLVAARHALLLAGWDAGLLGLAVGACLAVTAARMRRRPA